MSPNDLRLVSLPAYHKVCRSAGEKIMSKTETNISNSSLWYWLDKDLPIPKKEFKKLSDMCFLSDIQNINYEHELNLMSDVQIMEKDGELKRFPFFLKLPVITQTKFLYLLQTNVSLIPRYSLMQFIQLIGTSNNRWVQEMVSQLLKLTGETSRSFQFDSSLHLNHILSDLKRSHNDFAKDLMPIQEREDVSMDGIKTPLLEQSSSVVDVIVIEDDEDGHDKLESSQALVKLSCKPPTKKRKTQDWNESLDETEPARNISITDLPASICSQVKLNQLYNACKSKEMEVTIDMLKPFTTLTLSQTQEVCEFLDLAQITDKMLVNIFDNMPWQDITTSTAKIILDSCLAAKVKNLTCEPSDRLLSAVTLIATSLPQVLVDIFVSVLLTTDSGYFPCQLMTSVSKESLPLESIVYFIVQLVSQNIESNENLTSLLQMLIDRNPALDEDLLLNLLTFLSQSSQLNHSSSKFGKLLLSVMSKYSSMMSSKHKVIVQAIVDKHTSSLKKLLLNTMKKISDKMQ
ncbi:Fanconi anemia group E protein isoform X2 [Biomphalaria glabrata]|nr:Fanconi anemia group E protein isoform X2 [Biomphalaria glabrata]